MISKYIIIYYALSSNKVLYYLSVKYYSLNLSIILTNLKPFYPMPDTTAWQRRPKDTNTCGDFSSSVRWTLSLPPGRWFTFSYHHRKSTETFNIGNVSIYLRKHLCVGVRVWISIVAINLEEYFLYKISLQCIWRYIENNMENNIVTSSLTLPTETKAQFARDDPAFVVLLCFWLCGESYIY